MNGKFMSTFDTQGIMGAYATSTAKCVCVSRQLGDVPVIATPEKAYDKMMQSCAFDAAM